MNNVVYYQEIPSPIGNLLVASNGQAVTGLFMSKLDEARSYWPNATWIEGHPLLDQAREELDAYFEGQIEEFQFPIQLDGTPFQLKVWSELKKIPYGQTISYAELARRIGQAGASRAVGRANGTNRISIVVPCHRVISADGGLGGYGGGLDRKQWLLEHETSVLARKPATRTEPAGDVAPARFSKTRVLR